MSDKSRSPASQALPAVLLTIGFYALALAIIAVMFGALYWQARQASYYDLRTFIGAAVIAGAILWSVFPRPYRFVPPGPLLTSADQPRLFNLIQGVAIYTCQQMPAEVYLCLDVEAFVGERGGFMGFGTRRVMGIGLGLLQGMDVSEVRWVLAHEFGHYYGGDTGLETWVYKTRAALIRTIRNLGHGWWLQYPFQWYGKLFLRVTFAVSRQQELAADRLAAQASGPQAGIQALSKSPALASAFSVFWRTEVWPVLFSGYRPPLAQGFNDFLRAGAVAKMMDQVTEQKAELQADIYDSHPPSHERVACLQALPAGYFKSDQTSGISLIDNLPELEGALLQCVLPEPLRNLKPIEWQDVASHCYVPHWEQLEKRYDSVLQGLTIASLPHIVDSPAVLVSRIQELAKQELTDADVSQIAVNVLGAIVSLELVRRGWKVESQMGGAFVLRCGSDAVEPFQLVGDLWAAKTSADDWHTFWARFGMTPAAPPS